MPTVLVVDDNDAIRAMFARALSHIATVNEADGGLEALERLARRKYDFVLLDLHMPGINGFIVMNALSRDAGPNGRTPICVVSADSSEAARLCALRAHACYFLTKPVRVGALMALVSDSLRKTASAAPTL